MTWGELSAANPHPVNISHLGVLHTCKCCPHILRYTVWCS
jgi:hypothetical protein